MTFLEAVAAAQVEANSNESRYIVVKIAPDNYDYQIEGANLLNHPVVAFLNPEPIEAPTETPIALTEDHPAIERIRELERIVDEWEDIWSEVKDLGSNPDQIEIFGQRFSILDADDVQESIRRFEREVPESPERWEVEEATS